LRATKYQISICAALLLFSAAACSEEITEPRWVRGTAAAWCVVMKEKKACLPPNFVVNEFESGYASWSYREGDRLVFVAEYLIDNPIETMEPRLLSEVFTVRAVSQLNDVQLTEYSADVSNGTAPPSSFVVADFAASFYVTVTRDESEAVRAVAESLVNQWSIEDSSNR